MSKIKLGLSTVFMLILLGMFSAVAFAAAPDPSFVPTSTHPAPNIYSADVNNDGSQGTQRTHGNFQNNTNSCANCHSVHNGQTNYLLMKSGDSELCESCHDGTMGFYDVTAPSGAGVFDFDKTAGHTSVSMHNVGEAIKIGTAPGAYNNKSTDVLECSSCHNPHGSPNDRLLNEKVNGTTFATSLVNGTQTPVPTGTQTIKMNLTNDDTYKAVNDATGPNGVKITKSAGPVATATYNSVASDIYYSQFCGACHDDYFANRSTGKTSQNDATYQAAHSNYGKYTHTTNSSKQGRNCAACHYAHGTDERTLMDAIGNTIADYTKPTDQGGIYGWTQDQATAYMKDIAPGGSALKKFTNRAVCFACHAGKISTTVDPKYKDGAGNMLGKSKIVGN
ncbi:cytochrome c3 family protein [Neobacillus sp. PS3-12]|uniref:cytochrome c3 family protein n=1 Tax=Neobacillus sp. PS3-12 TaxID=3070677 RepID=UPI0027E0B2B1|nr:cytochrome c3 family protein [Neobacillus sp. PS3-12]WML54729.1 cytochrome c3 family protein [Neobacillus sp. PS3-12]